MTTKDWPGANSRRSKLNLRKKDKLGVKNLSGRSTSLTFVFISELCRTSSQLKPQVFESKVCG